MDAFLEDVASPHWSLQILGLNLMLMVMAQPG
jgi:hypothetical protein